MKIANYLNIAEKMKTMRKKSGISQRDMALKLGISNSAYSNYENGYNEPSIEILEKFCKLLDISFNDLIGIQIQDNPIIKTYADLFSLFFQLEDMNIPITFDFYSEPDPISKKTRKKQLDKAAENKENYEYSKAYTLEEYNEWKN